MTEGSIRGRDDLMAAPATLKGMVPMERFIEAESLEWQPVRPDVARGVFGRTILDGGTKMVVTRVEPGGAFAPHRDGYGHLFYFLAGSGIVGVGQEETPARPGLVARVAAGEVHWYRNTGSDDLVLISVNIP
ncbi:MAG TPA: cupin domain-containing protein [Desulfuromonadaceae bacterium]